MTEPTDAEIIALADETRTGEPGREGYILPISFARAVLAKWGQTAPQPVEREPLTHAQAKALVSKYGNDLLHLVYQVEVAHGITQKGGQHGAE